jgi:hypothetical protein
MHRNLWSWEKTFSAVHLLMLSMLVGLIGVAIFPIHATTPVGAAMAMPAGMVMPPGETMAGAMPASKPDKDKHKASHHHQLRKGDLVPPAQGPHPLPNIGLPPEAGPVSPQPQRPLTAAVTAPLATTTTAPVCQTPAVAQTINLKVLVIAADGSEADLPAITQTLTFLGTPYDVYVATQHSGSQPGVSSGLTPNLLSSGTTGFYQGVILTTGSLAYYNGSGYVSGLSTQEWQNLWTYESTFCIREVSWYTYPTADYGFQSPSAGVYPSSTPLNGTFTTAGQSLFGGPARQRAGRGTHGRDRAADPGADLRQQPELGPYLAAGLRPRQLGHQRAVSGRAPCVPRRPDR